MKVSELLSLIDKDGWVMVRQRGSHRQSHHPTNSGTVTVAGKHSIDIPRGTLNSVLKQAGLWVKGVIMQYLVVVEKGLSSYGAFVPDLPSCIAVGETEKEVVALIQEAILFIWKTCKLRDSPSHLPSQKVRSLKLAWLPNPSIKRDALKYAPYVKR